MHLEELSSAYPGKVNTSPIIPNPLKYKPFGYINFITVCGNYFPYSIDIYTTSNYQYYDIVIFFSAVGVNVEQFHCNTNKPRSSSVSMVHGI